MSADVTPGVARTLTPEYKAWRSMKRRCKGDKPRYKKNYVDRGIKIHPPWLKSYELFLAHVGKRPSPKHSLDRFPNNNGNYEPGNVRWATAKEQCRNKRNNRHLTFKQETHTECEWAEILGISPKTLNQRLVRWGECDKVFTTVKRNYAKGEDNGRNNRNRKSAKCSRAKTGESSS